MDVHREVTWHLGCLPVSNQEANGKFPLTSCVVRDISTLVISCQSTTFTSFIKVHNAIMTMHLLRQYDKLYYENIFNCI